MSRTSPLVVKLLASLEAAFTNDDAPPRGGVTGPPQLRAGEGVPALDNFDDCSLLWLNVTNRFHTRDFPTAGVDTATCGAPLAVWIQIGVARCSDALTYNGGLPTAEMMAAEFAAQEDDADRLDKVLCVAASKAERDDVILDWAPVSCDVVGPEGGTVAVVATAAFHLAN